MKKKKRAKAKGGKKKKAKAKKPELGKGKYQGYSPRGFAPGRWSPYGQNTKSK